jgi:hypothetical protein
MIYKLLIRFLFVISELKYIIKKKYFLILLLYSIIYLLLLLYLILKYYFRFLNDLENVLNQGVTSVKYFNRRPPQRQQRRVSDGPVTPATAAISLSIF